MQQQPPHDNAGTMARVDSRQTFNPDQPGLRRHTLFWKRRVCGTVQLMTVQRHDLQEDRLVILLLHLDSRFQTILDFRC